MKKKLLYILFVLTFFICLSNVEAYDESFCNGSTYACAVCNYKSDTYPSGISYAVKSNGSVINVSRDRSKLSNSFGSEYDIGTDEITSAVFYKEDNSGNDGYLKCPAYIYLVGRNMSTYVDIKYSSTDGTNKASFNGGYNNNLKVYSTSSSNGNNTQQNKTKACTYNYYDKLPMGYNTAGKVSLVSDGSNIISADFSDSSKHLKNSYGAIAVLFDLNASGTSGCPELSITCEGSECEITKGTLPGVNNSSAHDVQQEIDDSINPNSNKGPESRTSDSDGTAVNGCEGLLGSNVMAFLKLIRNFIMIAGPILALVLGTYDLVVALAGGDDEAKKKGMKKMKNRLVAAVLLLLIPYILVLILNIINNAGIDSSCIIN